MLSPRAAVATAVCTAVVASLVVTLSVGVSISAAPATPHTLYFAEGATGQFDTRITLVNPSDVSPATITLEAHTDRGETFTETLVLPALDRAEVSLTTLLGGLARAVSTVITSDLPVSAERRMRWLGATSADTLERAITAPSTTWLFAEGHVGPPFSLFYLFYNPGDTPATVHLRWMPASGSSITTVLQVAPKHRYTLWADAAVPILPPGAVGLEVTADVPIVAERAAYLVDAAGRLRAGTAAAGATSALPTWYFAEGSTAPFFDQFLLLLNPSTSDAVDAVVDFHLADGSVVSRTYAVPASRRTTIWLNAEAETNPALAALSTGPVAMRVTAALPQGQSSGTPVLVAERAMWGPRTSQGAAGWYQGHAGLGIAAPVTSWMIPAAASGGPFGEQTYGLIWNPSPTDLAEVTLDLLAPVGQPAVTSRTVVAPAGQRVTVELGPLFGLPAGAFSVRATSTQPVTVEYARYTTVTGRPLATGAVSAAVPLADPAPPCDPIVVTPGSVPAGVAGTAYGPVSFGQTGGEAPITWSVTGALPAGLALDPSSGELSGTPGAAGSFPITVTATDANACTGSVQISVQVDCPPITVTPMTLPDARANVAYSQGLSATGGSGPFSFAVTTGALPAGLALATDGTLSGTPTTAGAASFTITATGAAGCSGSRGYALVVLPESNDAPVLTTDPIAYATAGNTQLHVAGATRAGLTAVTDTTGIIGKAVPTDADGPGPLEIVPVAAGTSTQGGSFTLAADGSFTYVPAAGFTGVDSFTYTVTDKHPSLPATVTGTILVTVSEMVWYVRDVIDADNAAGGDGRSTNAFESLAAAEAASGETHTIFVFRGNTGTVPLDGGITLKNGQKLHGEGVALQLPTHGTLVPAGTAPVITNTTPGGNGVTVLASSGTGARVGVEVRGLAISGHTNAIDVTSADAAGLGVLISNNVVVASGAEGIDVTIGSTSTTQTLALRNNVVTAAGNGIDIVRGAGLLTITSFADNAVSGATGGNGVFVLGPGIVFDAVPGGSFDAVAGGALVVGEGSNPVGVAGVVLFDVTGALSYGALTVHASAGPGLLVTGTGPYTGTTGLLLSHPVAGTSMIQATGAAVDLWNMSAHLVLATINSVNSLGNGVRLLNVSNTPSSVPAFVAAGGSISGAAGTAFLVDGGNADVTYGGTIGNTVGRSVVVQNRSAQTVTFTGGITDSGTGILVSGNSGGATTFAGGLSLTTGANAAFTASNGGTVNVCDEFPCVPGATGSLVNTLTTTTGVALNVANTTIGASRLTFRSISANGAPSGIVLNNTGSVGGLTVAGNGGTCSSAGTCTGGAIQNTTSHGVSLTSTQTPSFDRLYVNNTGGHGVGGTEVDGFAFTNGVISNSGTDLAVGRANIGFNVTTTATERNLHGAVTITGNTLTNAFYHGVEIFNFNGTISAATISGNTITSSTSTDTSKGAGIGLIAFGSATTVASVMRADIANNVISNFPGGVGIQAQGGNANAAGSPGVFGIAGDASEIINITGNRIAGASAGTRLGAEAIVALVNGRGQGNFNISNNGTVLNPLTNITGQAISHSAFGLANVTSTISNNVIVANNAFASPGIGFGLSNTFGVADTPQMTVTVSNNTISNTDGNGILGVTRDTNGTLRAKVQNNAVAAPLSGVRPGIRIDSGNGGTGENDTVCLNISGNTSAGSGGVQGIGLRKQGTDPGVFAFGIHGMVATATPGVEAYVDGLNPGGNGTLLLSGTSGFTNCVLP